MKQTLALALFSLALCVSTQAQTAPDSPLKQIPAAYLQSARQQGTIERLNYSTDEGAKHASVYLPYGYSKNSAARYNVFYLMHGAGGSADTELSGGLKNIIDNMIQNHDLDPLIIVTPTYYPPNPKRGSSYTVYDAALTAQFPPELREKIIPAVDAAYNTKATREGRAFGGFSMGGVTTWYIFLDCLDKFKYFMPLSGDCWLMGAYGGNDDGYKQTAASLAQAAAGYSPRDYFIYAATGTSDMASYMQAQVNAMKAYPAVFTYSPDFSKGNLYLALQAGGTHTGTYRNLYIYNGLPLFFKY